MLILDDDEAEGELLRRAFALTPRLVDVHLIASPEKAIAFLYSQDGLHTQPRPDLILLDYLMPSEGGHVLSMLKGDPDLRIIPVIAMCRSHSPEEIRAIYDRHANCCILKPTHVEDLTQALETALLFWMEIALTIHKVPPSRVSRTTEEATMRL